MASSSYDHAFAAALGGLRRAERRSLAPEVVAERIAELLAQPPQRRLLLVRNSPRFRHVEICQALLRETESLRHEPPRRRLALAELTVAVAEGLDDSVEPGRAADARADAWAALANAQRVANSLEEANASLTRAHEYLEEGTADPLLEARLWSLEGSLRCDQRRYDEAVTLLRRAHGAYRVLGEGQRAAHALVSLGRTHNYAERYAEATRCLETAIELLEREDDPIASVVAYTCLASCLGEAGRVSEGLEVLARARFFYDLEPVHLLVMRMQWTEGRLLADAGRLEEAAARLSAVQRAFTLHDLAYDAALASLDLAAVLARLARLEEVAELAREMFPVFLSREIHREATAALLLFVRAAEARALSAEAIGRLARQVEEIRRRPAPA